MKRFSLITTTFCLCACTQTHQRHSIATIDGVEISNTIIDKTIEQQLYDKLYDIYELRHEAADKYLSHKVLDKEAIARHISLHLLHLLQTSMAITYKDSLLLHRKYFIVISIIKKNGKSLIVENDSNFIQRALFLYKHLIFSFLKCKCICQTWNTSIQIEHIALIPIH